jgi:hypothetical protein
MNPDFKAGMHAFDAGHPCDPAQRGQWRHGWETARDNAVRRVLNAYRATHPDVVAFWEGLQLRHQPEAMTRFDNKG